VTDTVPTCTPQVTAANPGAAACNSVMSGVGGVQGSTAGCWVVGVSRASGRSEVRRAVTLHVDTDKAGG
jgi:hypothetical protein